MNNYSGRIRQIMEHLGLTQRDFSDAIGVSQPAVSLYLKGRMPPADVLYRIARLGRTTMEWLLTGNDDNIGTAVTEKKADYGVESMLLERWRQLTPQLQKDILNLLKHLVD